MDFGFLSHAAWGGVYSSVFLASVLTAYIVTPFVAACSRRIGLLDFPNNRTAHLKPTPLGGGFVIAIAFVTSVHVGIISAGISESALYVVIFGGLVVLTLGFLDDYTGGISAVTKLIALIHLTLLLWTIDDRLILKIFPWEWLNLLCTLLWIAGVISAINAIDNMNGLSVGFVAIASLAYFAVAVVTLSQWADGTFNRFWALVSIALCGSCLGFLPYNFPAGRIFIGDAGSFFLGFNLAVLGVMGEWSDQSTARATIPLLILALPLFDLGFTVLTRHFAGTTQGLAHAIRHCARDHLSHRLVHLGLSKTQAVLILHAAAAALATSAVLLCATAGWVTSLAHLVQAGIVLLIIGVLIRVASKPRMKEEPHEIWKLDAPEGHSADAFATFPTRTANEEPFSVPLESKELDAVDTKRS